MNVEFTGRKCEITPALRKSVETGLAKIRKILGDKFDSKVVLATEKHRHKAEITVSPRNGPLVGIALAGDMKSAINQAMEHLENRQSNTRPGGAARGVTNKKINKRRNGMARAIRRACQQRSDYRKQRKSHSLCTSSPR